MREPFIWVFSLVLWGTAIFLREWRGVDNSLERGWFNGMSVGIYVMVALRLRAWPSIAILLLFGVAGAGLISLVESLAASSLQAVIGYLCVACIIAFVGSTIIRLGGGNRATRERDQRDPG